MELTLGLVAVGTGIEFTMEKPSHRKRILFVATREPSYPRVAMTLASLRELAEVEAIVCESRSYLWRMLSVGWRFLFYRKSGYDAVFVGFFAQPILPWIRLCWRGPLVVDAFISLYDSLVLDKGLASGGGVVGRLARWLDRCALGGSDIVLVDTDAHRLVFEEIGVGLELPRFYRLWASAQEEVFRKLPELSYDAAGEQVFEVLFWGAFIPLQGVNVIVEAAAKVNPERVRFTLVGSGQTYAECRELAERLGVVNVAFVAWQTPEQLVERARSAHLLLGIFGTTEKAKRVIPNKAFQALALGKPLLTGRSSGIAELLSEDEDVLLCEMGDATRLAAKIEWVSEHYGDCLKVGASGNSTFNGKAGAKDRHRTLKGLLDELS